MRAWGLVTGHPAGTGTDRKASPAPVSVAKRHGRGKDRCRAQRCLAARMRRSRLGATWARKERGGAGHPGGAALVESAEEKGMTRSGPPLVECARLKR